MPIAEPMVAAISAAAMPIASDSLVPHSSRDNRSRPR
jgi:hypothetical protein